jgi:hypothetical protein
MGGRGASSGISKYGNPYGSQYYSLGVVGNNKFVEKNNNSPKMLQESMIKNRVYALVDQREEKSIIYIGNDNKRYKQIDLDHRDGGVIPHVHHGYFHNENDSKKDMQNLHQVKEDLLKR